MKLVNNCLSLLLLLSVISSAPADAKKGFVKEEGKPKSALGENTKVTPSGVQYKDITVGTGAQTIPHRVVWIDYKGWVMPDLREFDNTITTGQPLNLLLGHGQICKGLDDGLIGMKEGGKRLLLIPPELGIKQSATTRIIPPGSTIKYEVTVLQVGGKLKKKPTPTDKPAGKAPSAPPAVKKPKN